MGKNNVHRALEGVPRAFPTRPSPPTVLWTWAGGLGLDLGRCLDTLHHQPLPGLSM